MELWGKRNRVGGRKVGLKRVVNNDIAEILLCQNLHIYGIIKVSQTILKRSI